MSSPDPNARAGASESVRPETGDGLAVGGTLRLRKAHACGGLTWTVTRLGADVGLECQTCQRRVMLPRDQVQRQRTG